MFEIFSTTISALSRFVIYIAVKCKGWLGYTVENSTLNSRPWRDGNKYWCSFELHPEWTGITFYVFKGWAHRRNMSDTDIVVKTFRHLDATSEDSWMPYTRACDLGRGSADMFNTHLASRGDDHKVSFVTPAEIIMDDISDVMPLTRFIMGFEKSFSEHERVVFEDSLNGDFKTFICSTESMYENGSDFLGSFCHFVYHQSESEGAFIFDNLKGVFKDNTARLTCPTVHSNSGNFSREDQGEAAIYEFFRNHVCTPVCEGFTKPLIK